MGLELRCEGFCPDEILEERLLFACRRAALAAGWDSPIAASIRLIEGRMQARLELFVPGRRIFSIVWRDDPVEAMEGAVEALVAVVGEPPIAA
jgi:hypothetical protein